MSPTISDWYVSPQGNDAWSGRLPTPNADCSDGPFATLSRAREALREHGAPGTVWLRGGDYVLTESFALTAEDGGTADAPVVYCALPGERARLLGGVRIPTFEPLSDPGISARLTPEARAHVVEADLAALGLSDYGQLRPRGFNRSLSVGGSPEGYRQPAAHAELFFDGRPMTLARWPNEGFELIAGYVEEQPDGHRGAIGTLPAGFYYQGDRPRSWQPSDDIWVHGYWAWDWANSYERVASLDLDRRLIVTAPPHGLYGFRTGNRFFFLNVLEELDSPGEYWVDRERGKLYFWPPSSWQASEALLSIVEEPLIDLRDASHIVLCDLVLEAGRGAGIRITGGEGVHVRGCTLRNLGTDGVVIERGLRHRVTRCKLHDLGDAGISAWGGDRATLTPCLHRIDNNHIQRIARWSRTYCTAVHIAGVGMRVAHNHIHDLPHTAVMYWGNDHLIEYNHIHHVTLETGDAGAIYTGRDYTTRGNLVRYNYIHDTGGYGMGSMGVYLDDCVSGQTIYGNLLVRCHRAVMVGGGSDIRVENNIFVDCDPGVWVDARGTDPWPVWMNMVHELMRERYEAMNPRQPPYSVRYPELVALNLEGYFATRAPIPPLNVRVAHNINVGGPWMASTWHEQAAGYLTWEQNLIDADPGFVSHEREDYRLRTDSPAWALGFKALPLERIGIQPECGEDD